MIGVSGMVELKVRFDIELNISEKQFNELSQKKQDELIDSHIDWNSTMQNAEIDEIDVWEVDNLDED